MYGDLVHADPTAAPGLLAATLNQRYVAAVLIYGQAAMAAVATLNVVRTLVAKGLVELDPESETSEVVVSTPMTFPVLAARVSPAGTMTTTASAPPAGTAGLEPDVNHRPSSPAVETPSPDS